jgi:hypothetical protein
MLSFVRLLCRILPLPIIQSLARDTVVRVVELPTIVHLHVGIPLLLGLITFTSTIDAFCLIILLPAGLLPTGALI